METQNISTVVEILGYGVKSMCILTNITMLIMEDPKNYRLHQFSNIKTAIVDAIEKGKFVLLNLEVAIWPSIVELDHLCEIVNNIAMKKKESTFTWWIRKPYQYQEACKKLREHINCDKIKLIPKDLQLVEGFTDTIAAYESIIELCKKRGKCRTARLLRTACSAVVAILTCAWARVLALQVGGIVTSQARKSGGDWADRLLKDFKDACKSKRKSLVPSTTEANKQLLERTESEALELEADILAAAKKSKYESVETDLSKLCELVMEARNNEHKLSEFLRYYKAHKSQLNKLQRLRDSCDHFNGRLWTAHNALVKYQS